MSLVVRYKDEFRSLQEHITKKEGIKDIVANTYRCYYMDSPLLLCSNYFRVKSLKLKTRSNSPVDPHKFRRKTKKRTKSLLRIIAGVS